MKTSDALNVIFLLRDEAEALGWDEGIALTTRAERTLNKGGALRRWGRERSRARKALVDCLGTLLSTYTEYNELCERFSESRRKFETEVAKLHRQYPNPQAFSAKIRQYAASHAYQDEKPKFDALLKQFDTGINNMCDPAAEKLRLELLAQSGKRHMEAAITGMVQAISAFLDESEELAS